MNTPDNKDRKLTPEERRNTRLSPLTWAIGILTFIVVAGAIYGLIVLASR